MTIITIKFANIIGESQLAGHVDEAEAVAIRDTIEVAVPQGGGRGRGVGQGRHGDIELIRLKDRASPKLAVACSAGTNLGDVKIYLFKTTDSGQVPYMIYELRQTFVSRVEHETEDDTGGAYRHHVVVGSNVNPSPYLGPAALFSAGQGKATLTAKPSVRPVSPDAVGLPTNSEIERLWLSPAQIRWTYTPYTDGRAGGNIEKGWNIQQGIQI